MKANSENGSMFTLECESFSLEHRLEWREVDDEQLANHREYDSHKEHAVCEQTDCEHRLCLEQITHSLNHDARMMHYSKFH